MFEGAAGGPALVDGLAAAVPAELEDADLVDAMKAWERLASWVAAGQLAVIAEFAGWRVERQPGGVLTWISPTGHRYETEPPAIS
jgi:hypothetical protein